MVNIKFPAIIIASLLLTSCGNMKAEMESMQAVIESQENVILSQEIIIESQETALITQDDVIEGLRNTIEEFQNETYSYILNEIYEDTVDSIICDYIGNKSSGKFHIPSCSSVGDMLPENKDIIHGTRFDAIEMGYEPCGRCKP